ncbi:MAG TPA: hypothetical protein VKU85_19975 [bacterium]|nr:hypothetical protein [bacterium]
MQLRRIPRPVALVAAALITIAGLSGCFQSESGPDLVNPIPDEDISDDTPDNPPNGSEFQRIHYSDLAYLGAFKCPDKPSWAFAKGPLAWMPSRGRLVAVGKSFAELELPGMTMSTQPTTLPEAYDPTKMFDPMSQLYGMLDPAKTLGGITWFERRIWIASFEYYNVAGRDNLGITSLDENWGDPRGAWRVGAPRVDSPSPDVFHANKTHGYVMVVPQNWSDRYTPGKRLAAGRHRTAGAFGGGKGPALYAFEADISAPPGSDLGGVPLMYFPERGKSFPGYRNADEYSAIWIWRDNRQAVIIGARKGLGANNYGPGTACSPEKGWNSHPYEPRMYFVDVNELGEVAQGKRLPWNVVPYDEVMPDEMWNAPGDPNYNSGCKADWMRDWAFDESSGLLYASEPRAYQTPDGSNRMIVHVWQVN